MCISLFENYSSTTAKNKGKLSTIEVNRPANATFDQIVSILEQERFSNIQENKEFLDIYAEKYGFELSVQLAVSGSKTLVDISVFGENKRGKTRGFLKRYHALFLEKL